MKNNFIKYSQTITICYDKDHQVQAYRKADKIVKDEGFTIVTKFFEGKSGHIELTKHYETSIK
jgi:hypothetical protein